MFNRETILKNLNTENYYIDNHSLDLFLEDWKIESIYEDEDGLEFYDDLALEKIKSKQILLLNLSAFSFRRLTEIFKCVILCVGAYL